MTRHLEDGHAVAATATPLVCSVKTGCWRPAQPDDLGRPHIVSLPSRAPCFPFPRHSRVSHSRWTLVLVVGVSSRSPPSTARDAPVATVPLSDFPLRPGCEVTAGFAALSRAINAIEVGDMGGSSGTCRNASHASSHLTFTRAGSASMTATGGPELRQRV